MMTQRSQTLFERIGGKEAVSATVVKLYEKILSDERLIPFFENVNIMRLRSSQVAFVTMAFGGPHHYSGENLRKAHAPLLAKGLTDLHFDAVAGHLAAAMRELNVAESLIAESLAVIETTRNDVLNRPG